VCNALAQPAANLLVFKAIPVTRQGFAFAVKQSAIPAATLLGGLSVPVLALTVGWRWAFWGAALLALFFATLPPRLVGTQAERANPGGKPSESLRPLAPLWVLALGIGFGAATASCLGTFLVTSSVSAGLSPSTAGLNMSLGSAVGIFGRLVAGHLADRRGGRHLIAVAAMLMVGAVACAALALGRPWIILCTTPIAFGVGWAWPGVSNLAIVKNYSRAPAAATGITQTGVHVGGVLGPFAFGVLVEELGYRGAWLGAAACSGAAALFVVTGRYALLRARRAG
jgi:predicted MFS family arabinose efflux permease